MNPAAFTSYGKRPEDPTDSDWQAIKEFMTWLDGFLVGVGPNGLTAEQVDQIRARMNGEPEDIPMESDPEEELELADQFYNDAESVTEGDADSISLGEARRQAEDLSDWEEDPQADTGFAD